MSDRRYTCGGKRRFRSQEQAKVALRIIRSVSTRERVPSRWYECPRCKGFHLSAGV